MVGLTADRLLGSPLRGDVSEAPDPAYARTVDSLGHRVPLEDPPVAEFEDLGVLGVGIVVQLSDPLQEALRINELPDHELEKKVVPAGGQELVRNAPELHEPTVEGHDSPVAVHGQKPIGRGVEGGAEEREGLLEQALRADPVGDVVVDAENGPSALVVDHGRVHVEVHLRAVLAKVDGLEVPHRPPPPGFRGPCGAPPRRLASRSRVIDRGARREGNRRLRRLVRSRPGSPDPGERAGRSRRARTR